MNLSKTISLCLYRTNYLGRHSKYISLCRPAARQNFASSHRNENHINGDRNQIKVLYDGQCPICVKEINLMKRLNKRENNVNFVDITIGEYNSHHHQGITYQQAMGKMHVIGKDKKIYDSMEAMKMMYSAVGIDWLSRFLSLPGVKEASDKFYSWFAINRYRLTGRNREECESGRCKISDKSEKS